MISPAQQESKTLVFLNTSNFFCKRNYCLLLLNPFKEKMKLDYDLTNNTSSNSGDAHRVEEPKDDDSSSDNKHQGLGLGRSGERVGGQGNGRGAIGNC